MEVAAFLVTTAASVTVIGKDPVPFFASLGEQVGQCSFLQAFLTTYMMFIIVLFLIAVLVACNNDSTQA